MKVFVLYSTEQINSFSDENKIKKGVVDCLNRRIDMFNEIVHEDISLIPARFSKKKRDVYIVFDELFTTLDKVYKISKLIKSDVLSIIQEDQKKCILYAIEVKVDPGFDVGRLKSEGFESKNNIVTNKDSSAESSDNELDYERRSKVYIPVEPSYSFDRVILPNDVLEKLEIALNTLKYEDKVFNKWGLYEIQPHPSSSLSFFGPPGTGKTMAAEAIASKLGKKILKVSYADVESKFHGEGPKMVKAIFWAAEREDAVLFFDEADSLLSKRLTNVSQGSEQAINSMRSQLLICLETFRGIVIFATNLVVNYDQAFLTRLISIEFKKPDVDTRKKIWNVHIRPVDDGKPHKLNIPLGNDVDIDALSEKYEFVGREIRNAVVSACVNVAMQERDEVVQSDLVEACDRLVKEIDSVKHANDHTVSSQTSDVLKEAIKTKLKEGEVSHVSVSNE